MSKYTAFLFDMNGTMINDMHFHELAWYNILVDELNAPLTQEQVKLQMYGKNEELFERVFGPGKFTDEEVHAIAVRKELKYQEDFLPHLKLIDGLDTFLQQAKANDIKLAIGTAAITINVDYVLDNLKIRDLFPVIIGAEDVAISKPNPDVFLKAAEALGIAPENCVVFEDSPKGIEAARRAGMKAVAITSFHTAEELANENVLCAVNDYNDPALKALFA
ncbi:HAD family hydrolase [Mucilaginibacter jinjuensis]|uniref:HAD family phosphatase n=1 Tax=Mucilaginibacter jinjuensis TaxID=1176721 RepID=A0ABY7T5B9_9SPHI|nr:HAD family phosphatase [Mucilaginibacter jinjuensis]WCT11484.1 HAD family phosphatase [Mucilaginibacter jinjuensis]